MKAGNFAWLMVSEEEALWVICPGLAGQLSLGLPLGCTREWEGTDHSRHPGPELAAQWVVLGHSV